MELEIGIRGSGRICLMPGVMGHQPLSPNTPLGVPAAHEAAGDSSPEGWQLIQPNDSRGRREGCRSKRLRASSNTITIKLEEGAACKTLPDHLVEKIITMMPFPGIFRARCLSKTWQIRFSSFSAEEEEAKRHLVPSLHRQVIERSSTWGTTWPVFICNHGQLYGYDRASQIWRKMPCLSFLPHDVSLEAIWQRIPEISPLLVGLPVDGSLKARAQIEGALLFACSYKGPELNASDQLYVANILTRSWKRLSKPPLSQEHVFYQKLVIDKQSQAYKVILVGEPQDSDQEYWSFQIYDSESDVWRRDLIRRQPDLDGPPTTGAYINGVLYMVSQRRPEQLMAYNLGERTFKYSVLSSDLMRDPLEPFAVADVNLVVVDGGLLMIVSMGLLFRYETDQRVLSIDPESGRSLQLAQGIFNMGNTQCVNDGKCIIFGNELTADRQHKRVHQYHLDTNKWSYFHVPMDWKWLGSCFQPGVNPFMAV